MSILDVHYEQLAEDNRKAEAAARKTCDNCGREFRTGYFGNDFRGGGWCARGRIYKIDGRWYHCCCDDCSWAIGRWVHDNNCSVPRLVGRETVARVLVPGE